MAVIRLTLPYKFDLREYQRPLWRYIVKDRGKRAFWCVHRRAGKDLTCWNIMVTMSQVRVGNYVYLTDEREHTKKIIWHGKDKSGRPFMDYIPKPLIRNINKTELRIEMKNGSAIQLEGTDEPDRLIGTNPVGLVLSEYATQKPQGWEYIRPILTENDGWVIFQGTARPPGESPHFKAMYDIARKNQDWFCELLTVDGTKAITPEQIDEERRNGMPESMIRQEFYCDFFASSDNILIPVDMLRAAIDRPSFFANSPLVAGIDVGHSLGGDPSAIIIRQGGRIVAIEEIKLNKLEEIAGWAGSIMLTHGCRYGAADGLGWGAGIGALIGKEYPGLLVNEVNVAENASMKELFNRRRDELWWKAREFFHRNTASIPRNLHLTEKLINELAGVTYQYLTVSNKIKIIGKEEMKKNGIASPNLADALCLTFADAEVQGNSWGLNRKRSYLAA